MIKIRSNGKQFILISSMLEKLQAQAGEDNVVNVEQQVGSVGAMTVDEQEGA
jgi:hypothetical protein